METNLIKCDFCGDMVPEDKILRVPFWRVLCSKYECIEKFAFEGGEKITEKVESKDFVGIMIKKLRNRILEVALRDNMGHIPSALSILDIIWTLYDRVMTPNDQFILSKGHGCMALYAVLEEKGLLDWSVKLWGHPKRGGAILASTGSLGHGLPMAVGIALAKKIKGEKGRVFCLIGDGECNEGTVWESALVAFEHKLPLTVIVDQNLSSERALGMGSIKEKFHAFGWAGTEIKGHDSDQIRMALEIKDLNPMVFIANTTKGNGVDFMIGDNSWHNRKITHEEYLKAIQ